MKVVYYSTAYFASHGGSNHSKQFFKEAGKDKRVSKMLLFPEEPRGTGTIKKEGKRDYRAALRRVSLFQMFFFYRRNKFYLSQLIQFIQREKPDAIVIRLDSNFLQIDKLRNLFPDLIITTEVNASPFDEAFKNIAFRNMFRSLERKSLSLADFNFFVSDNLRQRVMGSALVKERDRVVHNGVDPLKFRLMDRRSLRERYGYSDHDVVLGYIGTLDHHKKVGVLLESFKVILSEFSHAKLLIVGGGPDLESLKGLSGVLGTGDQINFAGLRPHSEISEFINCFDIAIHHKAGEYMSPLKVFEYMACGVPVIGPATPAVKEVFTDGVHLLLCDGTVPDLTSKIRRLLGSIDARKQMGEAGKKLVTENFTWEANADVIVSSIYSLKNHRR